MGQIHKNKFRTIHIPFNNEALEKTEDTFDDVNKSLGMSNFIYFIYKNIYF